MTALRVKPPTRWRSSHAIWSGVNWTASGYDNGTSLLFGCLRIVAGAASIRKQGRLDRHRLTAVYIVAPHTLHQMQQLLFFDDPTPPPTPLDAPSGDIVWGCDYGSGYFHAWRNGQRLRLLPDQFADLSFATAGDIIVVENAHMQPRVKSLAQVFSFDQLTQIKARAISRGVQIRLWFHGLTPKWRRILKMDNKSDEVDAETIARIAYIRGIDDMQYFNPRAEYPPRVAWAHEQIADMNDILNIARIDYKAKTCPCVAAYIERARHLSLHKAWDAHGPHSSIVKDIMEFFYNDGAFRQGVSLWAALVDHDGNPRSFEGRQPGVKFVMNELMRMRPNHFRGGVARSNIMYHGFRNKAIEHLGTRKAGTKPHDYTPEQRAKHLAYRQRYRRAMVATFHAMKSYIND